MGKSGSLVQSAGSAAFLSPEMGEQQKRNVPWREREDLSRGKEAGKKEQEKKNQRRGKRGKKNLDLYRRPAGKRGKVRGRVMRGLKWWARPVYQMVV